jgi:phosphate transport system protein
MNTQTDQNEIPHTLQLFEVDLHRLQSLLSELAKLVVLQLNQAMQSLDEGDMELAHMVMSRQNSVQDLAAVIDAEVISVLARQCPVANDLRTVISTSKIAVELEKIGAELVEFAKRVMVLFDPKTSDPNPKILTDIMKIGRLVILMLNDLVVLIDTYDLQIASRLIEYDRVCESELQEGITHQLGLVVQDGRMIGRALDIMQIMKSLEYCGEHCRNIAKYMMFMRDGHRNQQI